MELLGGVAVVRVELVAGNCSQHRTLGETAGAEQLQPGESARGRPDPLKVKEDPKGGKGGEQPGRTNTHSLRPTPRKINISLIEDI